VFLPTAGVAQIMLDTA